MGSYGERPKGLLIPEALSTPFYSEIIAPDDTLEGFQSRYPDIEWIAGDVSNFAFPRGRYYPLVY